MRWMRRDTRGFTLIEVAIAVAVLVIVLAGVAGVWAMAAASTRAAREQTLAMQLARDKLEQLAALTWAVRSVGGVDVLASDVTTNVSRRAGDDGWFGYAGITAGFAGRVARDVCGLSRCARAMARYRTIAACRRPLRAPLVAGAHRRRLVGDAAVPGARRDGAEPTRWSRGRVVAQSSECGLAVRREGEEASRIMTTRQFGQRTACAKPLETLNGSRSSTAASRWLNYSWR